MSLFAFSPADLRALLQPSAANTSDTQMIGVPQPLKDSERPQIPEVLPILPMRRHVIFPGTVVPLTIGRESSGRLLDECLPQCKIIGLVTQRKPETEQPLMEDLYPIGVAAVVLKLLRPPEGRLMIVAHALRRIRLREIVSSQPYLKARIDLPESIVANEDTDTSATVKTLRETAGKLLDLTPGTPDEAHGVLSSITEPGWLADYLASNLDLDTAQKQDLLDELDVLKRMRAVHFQISTQVQIAELQQKIQQDVATHFSDAQRKAYLREQVKVIQHELGEEGPGPDEQVEMLRRRLADREPPKHVMEQAEKELRRLYVIPSVSPEHAVISSYIETLADLPWNTSSPDNLNLKEARKILDRDHYDLDKVKRRIIEYLAVRKLNPEGRGPILCFFGPPGVGKTSLGQSIADALGRKFVRMSLGGIRDEAEIRGHRRTYIGAMPGRIIQELRRVGTRNPVFMLDEVDKIGADFRGDPAAALLEVLDPRQNDAFLDRYLDVPFDLSQVIFIATSNYMDPVPPALRDRMEVLDIPGYTESEKFNIAIQYLVPRQLKENGLQVGQCQFLPETLGRIILDYTHEAGVRDLERQIGSVCRRVAAQIAGGDLEARKITPTSLGDVLGPVRFIRETRLKTPQPGVVTGLAFTPAGGEVLHVEATKYPGKGNITLTGHIGLVMRESAYAALSLVKSRADVLGIDFALLRHSDVHIHVPGGAVPKDGPSAGIAMFTALASLFSEAPVRADVAMTGEVTLRGLVLPIGGLKEKALAAARAGILRVIIPKLNEKDLPDIPQEVRDKVQFLLAETVDDVLREALENKPLPSTESQPRSARLGTTPNKIARARASRAKPRRVKS